jgi:hypothetical protein
MQLPHIRAEIERMRLQVRRQRKEIQTLQRSGIGTLPAEALLARMVVKIDDLRAQRAKLYRLGPPSPSQTKPSAKISKVA